MKQRLRRSPLAPGMLSLLAGAMALSGAAAVHAQQNTQLTSQEDVSGFTLEGKISKVETGRLTVSTEENIIFHVRYDDKTEIKHPDGSAATAKEFRAGAHVKAAGEFNDSGEIAAKKIEIEKAPDSKTPPKQFRLLTITPKVPAVCPCLFPMPGDR